MGKIYVSYRRDNPSSRVLEVISMLRSFVSSADDIISAAPFGNINLIKESVQTSISECDAAIFLIDAEWTKAATNPNSATSLELAAAFDQRFPILPVLLDDKSLPAAAQMSPMAKRLTKFQAVVFDSDRRESSRNSILDWVHSNALASSRVYSDGEEQVTGPELPAQGYGPHFEIREDGLISFAPPSAVDRQGNNLDRLTRLHPTLRDLARSLVESLGHGNAPHSHLLSRAQSYLALIDRDLAQIDFSQLYVEGVRLANAERASSHDSDLPPLTSKVRENTDSLLQLHGTFVLSTTEGLAAIEAEERYRRTPQEEQDYRKAALQFAEALQAHPEIVEPEVATAVLNAAQEIGQGVRIERSGAAATGVLRNATITFSVAAAIGTVTASAVVTGSIVLTAVAGAAALVAAEGLKKSKPFAVLSSAVTDKIDRVSDFEVKKALDQLRERFRAPVNVFVALEPVLKQLASRDEFKWLSQTAEWIRQSTAVSSEGRLQGKAHPPQIKASRLDSLRGNIYLAKVARTKPERNMALVEMNDDVLGYLPFANTHPDYFQVKPEQKERMLRAVTRSADPSRSEDPLLDSFAWGEHRYGMADVIKRRQVLLVQVIDDEVPFGGPLLTTFLSLQGDGITLRPNIPINEVSNLIENASERKRLGELAVRLEIPEGMGVKFLKSAEALTDTQLGERYKLLISQWDKTRDLTLRSAAPALVYSLKNPIEYSTVREN